MAAGGVQALLDKAQQAAAQRERVAPLVCTIASSVVLAGVWGVCGYWGALMSSIEDPLQVQALGLTSLFAGLAAGPLAVPALWGVLRRRYLKRLRDQVRSNLLDRGLLLMALEPIPAAALLGVFEVPGREAGGQGKLALPQTPMALNTQSFAQRLRLLLERYSPACQALGLDAWPRDIASLRKLLARLRIILPVLGGAFVLLAPLSRLPEQLAALQLAALGTLLVARAATDDLLSGLCFSALHTVVAEELRPTEPEEERASVGRTARRRKARQCQHQRLKR